MEQAIQTFNYVAGSRQTLKMFEPYYNIVFCFSEEASGQICVASRKGRQCVTQGGMQPITDRVMLGRDLPGG
jgi:hypothetical protein